MLTMRHPTHYSADEARRRAALLIRGSWRATRGKSTARIDRQLEELAAEAVEREAAEKAAKKK